jgi:hypothetical protein
MFENLVRFVKNLFLPPHGNLPAVRQEMLVRSYGWKQNYRRWIENNKHVEPLKNLYTSYTLTKLGITGDIPMHRFHSNGSENLLVHYLEPYGKDQLSFLQDYFRDRIMRIGYSLYISDKQSIERVGYVETIERHILNPFVPAFSISEPIEQLYGKVVISLHYINERPLFLQISAEPLSEGGYNNVYSFDELAEILLI